MSSILRSSLVQFIIRNSFRKEMTLVIALKLLALSLIWGLFFSHPVSDQLKKPALVDHYVSSAAR